MWKSTRFKLESGLFPNIIQEDLVSWHHKRFIEPDNAEVFSSEDKESIVLDPGGMAMMGRDPYSIELECGETISCRTEHIIWLVNYFFNTSLLDDAISICDPNNDSRVVIEDDGVVKVYLSYSTLFVTVDVYREISNELANIYAKGVESYMGIVSALDSANIAHCGIKHCVVPIGEGEV